MRLHSVTPHHHEFQNPPYPTTPSLAHNVVHILQFRAARNSANKRTRNINRIHFVTPSQTRTFIHLWRIRRHSHILWKFHTHTHTHIRARAHTHTHTHTAGATRTQPWRKCDEITGATRLEFCHTPGSELCARSRVCVCFVNVLRVYVRARELRVRAYVCVCMCACACV